MPGGWRLPRAALVAACAAAAVQASDDDWRVEIATMDEPQAGSDSRYEVVVDLERGERCVARGSRTRHPGDITTFEENDFDCSEDVDIRDIDEIAEVRVTAGGADVWAIASVDFVWESWRVAMMAECGVRGPAYIATDPPGGRRSWSGGRREDMVYVRPLGPPYFVVALQVSVDGGVARDALDIELEAVGVEAFVMHDPLRTVAAAWDADGTLIPGTYNITTRMAPFPQERLESVRVQLNAYPRPRDLEGDSCIALDAVAPDCASVPTGFVGVDCYQKRCACTEPCATTPTPARLPLPVTLVPPLPTLAPIPTPAATVAPSDTPLPDATAAPETEVPTLAPTVVPASGAPVPEAAVPQEVVVDVPGDTMQPSEATAAPSSAPGRAGGSLWWQWYPMDSPTTGLTAGDKAQLARLNFFTSMVAGVSGVAAAAGRLSLVKDVECGGEPYPNQQRTLAWHLHPTRAGFTGDELRDAIYANTLVLAACAFLSLVAAVSARYSTETWSQACAAVRAPGFLIYPFIFLLPGTVVSAMRLALESSPWQWVGIVYLGLVGSALVAVHRRVVARVTFNARALEDPMLAHGVKEKEMGLLETSLMDAGGIGDSFRGEAFARRPYRGWRRHVYRFVYGTRVWVCWDDQVQPSFVPKYGSVFTRFRPERLWAVNLELWMLVVMSLAGAWLPGATDFPCAARSIFLCVPLAVCFVAVLTHPPYIAPMDNVFAGVLTGAPLCAATTIAIGMGVELQKHNAAYSIAYVSLLFAAWIAMMWGLARGVARAVDLLWLQRRLTTEACAEWEEYVERKVAEHHQLERMHAVQCDDISIDEATVCNIAPTARTRQEPQCDLLHTDVVMSDVSSDTSDTSSTDSYDDAIDSPANRYSPRDRSPADLLGCASPSALTSARLRGTVDIATLPARAVPPPVRLPRLHTLSSPVRRKSTAAAPATAFQPSLARLDTGSSSDNTAAPLLTPPTRQTEAQQASSSTRMAWQGVPSPASDITASDTSLEQHDPLPVLSPSRPALPRPAAKETSAELLRQPCAASRASLPQPLKSPRGPPVAPSTPLDSVPPADPLATDTHPRLPSLCAAHPQPTPAKPGLLPTPGTTSLPRRSSSILPEASPSRSLAAFPSSMLLQVDAPDTPREAVPSPLLTRTLVLRQRSDAADLLTSHDGIVSPFGGAKSLNCNDVRSKLLGGRRVDPSRRPTPLDSLRLTASAEGKGKASPLLAQQAQHTSFFLRSL